MDKLWQCPADRIRHVARHPRRRVPVRHQRAIDRRSDVTRLSVLRLGRSARCRALHARHTHTARLLDHGALRLVADVRQALLKQELVLPLGALVIATGAFFMSNIDFLLHLC